MWKFKILMYKRYFGLIDYKKRNQIYIFHCMFFVFTTEPSNLRF